MRTIKKKGKKTQIIMKQIGNINTVPTDIKKKKTQSHKHHCGPKFENVCDIDQFLGRLKVSNLTQKEIDNLKNPIFIK